MFRSNLNTEFQSFFVFYSTRKLYIGLKRPRHSSSRGRRNANVIFYLFNEVTMVLLVLNILDS